MNFDDWKNDLEKRAPSAEPKTNAIMPLHLPDRSQRHSATPRPAKVPPEILAVLTAGRNKPLTAAENSDSAPSPYQLPKGTVLSFAHPVKLPPHNLNVLTAEPKPNLNEHQLREFATALGFKKPRRPIFKSDVNGRKFNRAEFTKKVAGTTVTFVFDRDENTAFVEIISGGRVYRSDGGTYPSRA